jgi:hypothetical protein
VTDARKRRAIELAACLSVLMHLLLFMAVRPSNGSALSGIPVPPETHYLAKPAGNLPRAGSNIRTLWSPVLFSLPSEMGFSRDLLNENLRTRLTFSQQVESEQFLKVDPVLRDTGPQVVPQDLMVTAGAEPAPRLPQDSFQTLDKRPAARRVYVAPELKERLVGGVVLPPALNKDVAAPWEVRADVSISKQGAVRHVFLDRPLESAPLNRQVLQLLYGLRFSPGTGPVEGSIEIYSPETTPTAGAEK